jgi:hypothetical protein
VVSKGLDCGGNIRALGVDRAACDTERRSARSRVLTHDAGGVTRIPA